MFSPAAEPTAESVLTPFLGGRIMVPFEPSWWTWGRTAGVLSGSTALAVAALAWVVLLRRRVRAQTEAIRERLEAEAALEERYRELFENATDMVYTHDLEGNYTSVNRAAERIFGYTHEDLLRVNAFTLIAPEYRESSQRMLQQKLANGGETKYEIEVIAKNGDRVPVEVSSRLVLKDGHPVAVHGVIRDITERRNAELRNALFSNLGYRLNIARSPKHAAEIIVEVADELFGWDACYLHLYSPDHQGVIPVIHFDTVNGDRVAVPGDYVDLKLTSMDREILANGKKLILRQRTRMEPHPNLAPFGDTNRLSASLMFVPIRHGTDVVGVFSIQSYTFEAYDAEDLNTLQGLADHCGGALARIRSAQALEKSERQFRALIEHSSDGVSLIDAEGRVLYSSPTVSRILGYSVQEDLGASIFKGIHPDDLHEMRKRFSELLSQPGSMVTARLRSRHKDRSWRWLEGTAKNLLHDQSLRAIVLNYRDVTERTNAEEDRHRLEAQLRHSQKMEAVGQLAAGIAHDFNNILTIIQGHTSLLLGGAGCDTEMSESLKKILIGTERAASLTRQLLTFSRKQLIQPGALDLRTVIGNVFRMLQRLLGDNIVIECDVSAELPLIYADSGLIEQMIVNLAVNARDAMPEGGTLRIGAIAVEINKNDAERNADARPGQFVCISVSDTGCGMDAATLSKIFEPFFTTKQLGKGTGLGLSMVYGIIKQHQGWIEVTSEIGSGTIFKIYFPVTGKSVQRATAPAVPPTSLNGNGTILIVEDESVLRHLVSHVLRLHGYNVFEAASGPQALRVWQEQGSAIDLLFTDVLMPEGLSGFELAAKLQREKPSLKVIFTSGYSEDVSDQGIALLEGVNFLSKPYQPASLAEIVRKCLESSEA